MSNINIMTALEHVSKDSKIIDEKIKSIEILGISLKHVLGKTRFDDKDSYVTLEYAYNSDKLQTMIESGDLSDRLGLESLIEKTIPDFTLIGEYKVSCISFLPIDKKLLIQLTVTGTNQ